MTVIQDSIDKTVIPSMPQVVFYGDIRVIDNLKAAEEAIAVLESEAVVGFDTETRPSFVKGTPNKIALLQLATRHTSYLFRLNEIGIPECVKGFLTDGSVLKIGLSVRDDFRSLNGRSKMKPKGFVDLQEYMPQFGVAEKGLQRLYALLFARRISKTQQLSNWEAPVLSAAQQQYASIDAWAPLRIYNYMEELRKNGNYQVNRRYAEESVPEKG